MKLIDVQTVLERLPKFEVFCSVARMEALVERLQTNPHFEIRLAGLSRGGRPIHHVRFGSGGPKALFLGFPHACEPIGGLTVSGLLTLLEAGEPELVDAGVEWHFVPCADPDGAILNEPWSQRPTLSSYLRNYYMQPFSEQAAMSYPIHYKKMVWDNPSHEARIVIDVLRSVDPDFYYSLHNTRAGGVFYGLSHGLSARFYDHIHAFLNAEAFPIQKRPPYKEVCEPFAEGIAEVVFMKKLYDYMERFTDHPEHNALLKFGANDWDYVQEVSPHCLTMFAETGCLRHPFDQSERPSAWNLRDLRLRLDANSKFLASVMTDQWRAVRDDLDDSSPFFRVAETYLIQPLEKVAEGGWPLARYPTVEILRDPDNNRWATEGEVFNVCVMDSGLYFLWFAHQFPRLLAASASNPRVAAALAAVQAACDQALAEIGRFISLDELQFIDCNTLARVQVGSGLIVLNELIEAGA